MRTSVAVLSQAMFKRMSQFLLRPGAKEHGATFVFLDEVSLEGVSQ